MYHKLVLLLDLIKYKYLNVIIISQIMSSFGQNTYLDESIFILSLLNSCFIIIF